MEQSTFHVLIIGAGICGLSAAISVALEGHQVSVFESAPHLHDVGAGIQITPNGVRLLRKWNIELESKSATPRTLSIIRYDGHKILAHRNDYHEEIESRYGHPIWCLHRIDLQKELAARAEQLGVGLFFNSRVLGIDFKRSTLTLQDGSTQEGQLIVAADGLWSSTRSLFFAKPLTPQPTGDLAYRIVLTKDQINADSELADPELHDVMTHPGIRIWMGPGAHAVAYSLLGGEMMNVVLLVPDSLPSETAKAKGNIKEMAELFEDWDPLLKKFLSCVKQVDKWRLMSLRIDDSWRSEQGTFIMAGDSCHPILPYMAQGASLALEDGASLGALLGKIRSESQIPVVTRVFEKLRKERALVIREETFRQQEESHLPDGSAQESRDKQLATSFNDGATDATWTHPKIQPWLFGYDAYAEAVKAWNEGLPSECSARTRIERGG